MAANEYYHGSAGAQQLQNQRPHPYPSHSQPRPQYPSQQAPSQSSQQLQHFNNAPPPYSSYPPQQQQGQLNTHLGEPQYQQWPANGRPAASTPYPTTPPTAIPQQYPPQAQAQGPQNGYLGAPLQPYRSHSQPPRVHFADEYDSDSSDRSYLSDSDSSRRRHRRHKHRHRHDRSRSRSDSRDRDYDHSRQREVRSAEHKDRDTFLGAGAGSLIGDVIFPGLGTAAGLILGGYGGRKHAKKRSRSEGVADREHHHHRGRRPGEDGWDESSATFKKGHHVR